MFKGADGTDADSTGAAIIARVNGTPGVNDMPGFLTFLTTNDGTNSPTERLRINSYGNVSIGSLTDDSIGSTTTLTIDRSGGNGQISFAANGTVRGRIFADNSTSDFRIGNPTSNDLMLYTNNLERLRIAANGTITAGAQYDQVKIEPGNGIYDGEATTLSVDGRTNDGNRIAFKVDRYLSGTSATTKFSVKYDGTIFTTSGMQGSQVLTCRVLALILGSDWRLVMAEQTMFGLLKIRQQMFGTLDYKQMVIFGWVVI